MMGRKYRRNPKPAYWPDQKDLVRHVSEETQEVVRPKIPELDDSTPWPPLKPAGNKNGSTK